MNTKYIKFMNIKCMNMYEYKIHELFKMYK